MRQLSNFGALALIVLLQGVSQIQSEKASFDNNEKSSRDNENEDNIIYTDMLASMLRFINEHKNLEIERDGVKQINQKDFKEGSETMYPRNGEHQTFDKPVTSHSIIMESNPFLNDHIEVPYKRNSAYLWGSNPILWQANRNPITAEFPITSGKTTNYRAAIISPDSRWESNPSFWGKRDFWTTRGKKPYKSIGSFSKIVEKDPDNFAFWKSRGKREGEDKNSRSSWTPEELLMEPNYWTNRGKKADNIEAIKSSNFKRELENYWTARGRRRMDEKPWKPSNVEDGGIPYWVPRGKKNI